MDQLQHVFYINLAHREDRREHVVRQLESIGLQHHQVQRFEAIRCDNGAIGCSMSHLKLLQMAKQHQWDNIMIVEDDITFLNPDVFITQLNRFLNERKGNQEDQENEKKGETDRPTNALWDVLLLAGNNMPPYHQVDDVCVQVSRCQTTTGYIVQRHYYNVLIDNIKSGLTHLIYHPEQHSQFALDKYWFALQQKDYWYLLIPLTVVQLEGYSDIEQKEVDYHELMLDLDKAALMEMVAKKRALRQENEKKGGHASIRNRQHAYTIKQQEYVNQKNK